jgi:hypothetical protein
VVQLHGHGGRVKEIRRNRGQIGQLPIFHFPGLERDPDFFWPIAVAR